jgi:preprotein translocase subunit SecD
LKTISWRLIIVGVVIIGALVYILPSFNPGIWPHNKINLGLDLQGGMHLVLEVDTDKAVESTVERIIDELRGILRSEQIRYVGLEQINGDKISLKIPTDKSDAFNSVLDKEYPDLRIASRSTEGNVLNMIMDLPDGENERIKKLASAQALETIRNRIDEFGVSEPDIRTQGEKRILIQLPGIKDTQRAKELIGQNRPAGVQAPRRSRRSTALSAKHRQGENCSGRSR